MTNSNQGINKKADNIEQLVWEKVEVKLNSLVDTHITTELLVDELCLFHTK